MDIYQDSRCLDLEKALDDDSVDPINLPFLFLKAITKDFSHNQIIGSGGFGSVYKGELRNGMVVAVKKLHNKIEILEGNFQSEVACLIQAKHKNIVRFLGYCYETQHTIKPYRGRSVWADERQMLFCFEYLSKGNLSTHLTEPSTGLPWKVRYQIIRGICDGVGYLHQQRIIHMDLKPQNILLDDSMVPKIADLGIARRLSENKSMTITENIIGTRRYLPPEFLSSGTITMKIDIYSLGVIIIEILMGRKECPNVDKVLESWTNTFGISKSSTLLQQVKLCAEIGIDCMHDDPSRRPGIHDIIHRLNETDISVQLSMFYQYYRQFKQACKPMQITASVAPELRPSWLISKGALLDVHPLELCFPFEAKKVTQCSVNLINRTDCYFAYFIRPQFQDMYAINLPISYDLDPMSTIVLNMEMVEQELPPSDVGMFEILMISMESKRDLQTLESSIGKDPQKIDNDLLKRVEELDGEVHAAMLSAIVCPQRDVAPKVISRVGFGNIETIDVHSLQPRVDIGNIRTIDVHSTQPWILMGHGKLLSIWYYEMEATIVFSLDIKNKARRLYRMIHDGLAHVTSVRFIPRREWCVAGDDRGYIHVYTCLPLDQIKSFKATGRGSVQSLAIHPTCPYLLSMCKDDVIKIWDWDKGWACSRKVETGSGMNCATFNPMDANTFVTSHVFDGLQVWSINPSADHQPIAKIECRTDFFRNTPSRRRLSEARCGAGVRTPAGRFPPMGANHWATGPSACRTDLLRHDHVFSEAADRNYVVVTNITTDPQIWDLQTGTCVHTLVIHDPRFRMFSTVACHPTLPLIALGGIMDFYDEAHPPAICFWNSTNYRLEKTVWCTSGYLITYLGFVGSRRLVIGYDYKGIEVLEIDMESLACQQ